MKFLEFWKTSTETFQKEPNVTNKRFVCFGHKQKDNESMEQFFGALSDLTSGSDLGDCEASIVRNLFIFIMENEEVKKQLCM